MVFKTTIAIFFSIFFLSNIQASELKEIIIDSTEVPEAVSKWIDEELSKVEKPPIQNFESDSFFSRAPAKIIGYIKGFDPKIGSETGMYNARNDLTREGYPVTIEIYPNGRFEADIPLIHPVSSFIDLNDKYIRFYLEPGQTLAVILDWQDLKKAERNKSRDDPQKSVEFRGKLASINEELSNFELIQMDSNRFMDKVKNLTPNEFKEEQDALHLQNKEKLVQYFKENTISNKSKTLLILKNDLQTATNILNFLDYRSYEKSKDSLNNILNTEVENAYYTSFLKELPLDEQSLLVLQVFPEFINRFEYIAPLKFSPRFKEHKSKKSLLEYFEELGVELTEKEKELHLNLGERMTSNEGKEKFQAEMKAFGKKYENEVRAYAKYVKSFGAPKMDLMEPWRKKDSVLANHLDLKNNLVYDITKTRELQNRLSNLINSEEEAYDYWKELSASIENPFLKKEGKRIIEKKFPSDKQDINPDSKNVGNLSIKNKTIPLPRGKGRNAFKALMENHNDKIIFVDFWAIWCAPCIGTIERMKETRKKYKNNPDLDFVFITDESSPLGRYESFIKEQELNNTYRVDTDTFNRFRELFKFNGIPKYIVVDKNGALIYEDFKMYRFDSFLPKILENYK
ncbi:Thiol-disulfide isomerase or thioredoxin [Salegentibacter echinorum]|uniref:Thiol-disulfide isomerase or thioredoxin n=1 Tax=Salegentibacter echinorum TaxID=1073325 RepID=A0A1M5KTZ7_SALEC|nr:TlpA disulfide reductase family protein [Salegentibacter echinorum]SHG56274.1 Thiol-disulfide isomerase or thioredoxin [Salegentibacter echinorum]